MRSNMYSIYDKVAGVFNKPFIEFNDETAIRLFAQGKEEQAHFNDYELYHLGVWIDHEGIIEAKSPDRICTGLGLNNQE